jgi:acyl-CoA synthetase (AMP-forming)/AMP-acid ligase II
LDRSRLTPALAMERRSEFADSEVASRIDGRIMTHSCGQLLQRVDRLDRVLRSSGNKPGDRVGTLASNLPRARFGSGH